MHKAAHILRVDHLLERNIHRQLKAYLPIISGARMLKDYLKFLFPQEKEKTAQTTRTSIPIR